MTSFHSMYSEFLLRLNRRPKEAKNWTMYLVNMTRHIDRLKRLVCEVIDVHYESSLYRLKFHVVYYLIEYVDRFDTLQLLDSSAFELYNTLIKSAQ